MYHLNRKIAVRAATGFPRQLREGLSCVGVLPAPEKRVRSLHTPEDLEVRLWLASMVN